MENSRSLSAAYTQEWLKSLNRGTQSWSCSWTSTMTWRGRKTDGPGGDRFRSTTLVRLTISPWERTWRARSNLTSSRSSRENNTTVVLAASGNRATSCTDLPAPENQASSRRWRSFSTTSSPTRALKHLISALQIDGDRRGARRRLILESGSRRSTAEDGGDVSGPLCGGGGSSPAVKELRKLYGLLRIKSSRKSESLDVARENRDW